MRKFLEEKSKTVGEKVLIVFAGFGIGYIWINVFGLIFKTLVTSTAINSNCSILQTFVFSVIFAPLWEEAFARVGMVYFTKHIDKVFLIPVMILSSVIFGWLHGSVVNVFFQGVLGFIFASVYVKNNYCYWSAVISHALWNGMILIQILTNG